MEGKKMNNSQNKNLLTEGSIWKKLMGFAFPLFLGNLFQQLYNTADSLIVGNFLGSDALAAVSSSGKSWRFTWERGASGEKGTKICPSKGKYSLL